MTQSTAKAEAGSNSEDSGSSGAVGRITRILGPVVDVEFPVDDMPEMYNKLEVELDFLGEKKILSLEVALYIGDGVVRAISLQPTDGLYADGYHPDLQGHAELARRLVAELRAAGTGTG